MSHEILVPQPVWTDFQNSVTCWTSYNMVCTPQQQVPICIPNLPIRQRYSSSTAVLLLLLGVESSREYGILCNLRSIDIQSPNFCACLAPGTSNRARDSFARLNNPYGSAAASQHHSSSRDSCSTPACVLALNPYDTNSNCCV